MIKKPVTYILLALIILIAVAMRFYKLGELPSGLYIDEASQGYSAYSILKTGKDEFGKSFPFVFRAMLDFRAPVYTYMVSAVIPVFGLTPFAVRFPSFLFGVLTIPVVFFLVKHLAKEYFALVVSFLLAISPWHILFSRTAYESNVSLFFLLLGSLFLIKSLKKPWFITVSAVAFAVSVTAYQSERIIVPLILLAYFLKYRLVLLDKKRRIPFYLGIAIGLIILIPTITVAFTPGFLARASGINIFSHAKQLPDGFIREYSGILSAIINGSWFLSIREFLWHYFSYFSPRYMFLLGDSDLHISYPEISTFYIWQLPFYIFGLWILFRKKLLSDLKFFILTFLFISAIPAAVTRDPYSTLRSLPLVIPQIIIIALGIENIYPFIKNRGWKAISVIFFIVAVGYSILKFYSSAFILNDFYRARYWSWGWREVSEVINNLNTQNPIVVDNSRADPELLLAFFLKYNPENYQKENTEIPINEYYTNLYRNREKHVGLAITRPINWQNDLTVDQYLIGDELAISYEQIKVHNLTLVKEIFYPDETVAFRIVKTNPIWEQLQRKGKTPVLPKGTE